MKVLQNKLSTHANTKLFEFTQSLDVDSKLYSSEIKVQKAWCEGLFDLGLLSESELTSIHHAFHHIETQMRDQEFEWHMEDEDIHMNIERALTERLGVLGKKVHLGRSRNDLIATTLRLFLNDQLSCLQKDLLKLIQVIIFQSKKWSEVITPGLTHQQFGQPVRFSHIFSSHAWALFSDLKKLENAKLNCLEYMPLGSAALAGTHLKIDLLKISKKLGFKNPPFNAYHAVGDRDFMLESLSSFSHCATHLSRLCEDMIFWSQTSVGVLKIPYEWSTGSSIMPNKRNPDVLELVRAKMSRVISHSQEGFMIVKSVLPSYGSDLSEFKRTFINSFEELKSSILIFHAFIKATEILPKNAEILLNKGHLLATDLANSFVESGQPFREAYLSVSAHVETAEQNNLQVHQSFKNDLSFLSSVEARTNQGGTALNAFHQSMELLESKLAFYS